MNFTQSCIDNYRSLPGSRKLLDGNRMQSMVDGLSLLPVPADAHGKTLSGQVDALARAVRSVLDKYFEVYQDPPDHVNPTYDEASKACNDVLVLWMNANTAWSEAKRTVMEALSANGVSLTDVTSK